MLKLLKEIVNPDIDIKLVIKVEELLQYPYLMASIYEYTSVVENIHMAESCLVIVFIKGSKYVKFMRQLQARGLNLRENDDFGLTCTLVEYKKEAS